MSTEAEYADLEIRISRDHPEGYKVEIRLDPGMEFSARGLSSDLLPWAPGDSTAEDGERLFQWIFATEQLKQAWAEARGQRSQRRIRLCIDAEAPELHTIPWELLRDPGYGGQTLDLAAATATPFSRYLEGPWTPGSLIRKRPIRILVAIASPQNLDGSRLAPIDPEKEFALMEEAVQGLGVDLVRLPEPWTLRDLGAALRKGVHFLHLVAHGTFDSEAGAALFLTDGENQVDLVDEAEFAAMLRNQLGYTTGEDRLQLVFLASCQTAARSPADAFRGLAPKLVEAGAPAVLAMQDRVGVVAMRAFARTFYECLLDHGLVDRACNEARFDLLTAGVAGTAIPVLFLRVKDGRLLAPPEEARRRVYTPPAPPEPDQLAEPGPLPPGSRLPLDRNALFTGREAWLKALARALVHGEGDSTLITQSIQGMGGIGKTQLAVEFAYRYGRFFHGVHWLDCGQPDAIAAEIAACGGEMALSPWPQDQPDRVERTLQAWGQDGHRHLVILDNLEKVKAARGWLLQLRPTGAALLLTARRQRWPRDLGLAALRIGVFPKRESRRFLRRYLPRKRATAAELEQLEQRLGRLPLALELAGRYLDGSPLPVATYVEKLDKVLSHKSMAGWAQDLDNPTGHDLDLLRTFALSWEELEGEVEAQCVFALAGHCAPNHPIPCELLAAAAGLDEEACAEALMRLTGLSLLEMDDPAAGPTVHPLLAEYARTLLAEPQEEEAFAPLPALAGALAALAIEANQTGLPARFAPLRPHMEAVAPAAEAAQLEGAGTLWNEIGYHLNMVADYPGARAAYQRALDIDEATLGSDHPKVAVRVNNLGSVLHALGEYEEARAAFQRALAIDEAAFGPDHPTVATLVNNLGGMLQALGEYEEARAAFERVLNILDKTLPPEHPYVGATHNNLGLVLQALGEYEEARAAYQRALAIDEAAFGPDHPKVATRLNNLGSVLQALGEYEGTRAAFQRALAIDEATYGPDHPNVARDVNNLSYVLEELGDLHGAHAAAARAYTIWKASLPSEHPNVHAARRHLEALRQQLDQK